MQVGDDGVPVLRAELTVLRLLRRAADEASDPWRIQDIVLAGAKVVWGKEEPLKSLPVVSDAGLSKTHFGMCVFSW